MYGAPTVPALGGGWLLTGFLVGHFAGWIYAISLLIIFLIIFSMYRLIRGEINTRRTQA